MLEEFAEAFGFLGKNPEAGHERQDLAHGRPLLFWPLREYLIIYLAGSQPLRVVHDRAWAPGCAVNDSPLPGLIESARP